MTVSGVDDADVIAIPNGGHLILAGSPVYGLFEVADENWLDLAWAEMKFELLVSAASGRRVMPETVGQLIGVLETFSRRSRTPRTVEDIPNEELESFLAEYQDNLPNVFDLARYRRDPMVV